MEADFVEGAHVAVVQGESSRDRLDADKLRHLVDLCH